MRPPHLRVASLLVLVMIASTGCIVGSHIGSDLSPNDLHYPKLNDSAKDRAEIRGTAPPGVDVELSATYSSDVDKRCRYTHSVIAGAVEGAYSPIFITIPLSVTRDGDRFHTTVLLDRYEAGRCNWWFSRVAIRVGRGTTSTWTGTIMTAADERKEPICGGYSPNGGPEPVTLRCKFTPSITRPSSSQPQCGGQYGRRFFDKDYQRLICGARTVEIRVIDVDDETD